MTIPLVSVIIPAYNHEKYIVRCLKSVYQSEYNNIELIVLDDGASDNTFELASDWIGDNKDRFKRAIIKKQKNAGVCTTLNRLVALSKGDFITPVASDDMMSPDGITKRINYLLDNQSLLAVFGNAYLIDESDRIISRDFIADYYNSSKKALKNPGLITSELILNWCVPGPVFMARREAYDPGKGVGLYDESLVGEDRDFYLRLLSKNLLGFIDENVALYRQTPSSLSRNHANGLRVLPYWIESDYKNLEAFHGFNKVFLRFIAFKKSRELEYLKKRTIGRRIIKILFNILNILIYRIHLVRVSIICMFIPA